MVKNSSGFTLIELIFGILISSILVSMLYLCLYQLQRAARVSDNILSVDMRVLTLKNQLSRDLAGAFMPQSTGEEQKYFFGESDHGNLKLLTFISVNPLRTAIETNPKIVRVRYQVSSVPEQPDTFKIQRAESNGLEYIKLADARNYIVIDEIKSLKVTYFMPEEKPEKLDKSEKADGAKNNKISKTINDKSELLKINFIAKQAGEFKNLPAYIKFNLELWDSHDHIGATSYELDLPVYTYKQIIQVKEKNKPDKDQSEKDKLAEDKLKKDQSEQKSGDTKNNSGVEKKPDESKK
jgi:prepilin-type N-terminal cleavage/methylation domain-containing protein